jgi:hypothetical protein
MEGNKFLSPRISILSLSIFNQKRLFIENTSNPADGIIWQSVSGGTTIAAFKVRMKQNI